MKKNHHKKKGRRNDSGGGARPPAARPKRRITLPRRGAPPEWKTALAAVLGGGVSAAVGGLIVNQHLLEPETVGLGMMVGGAAAAYFGDGTARIVSSSVAAAGAGQLALAIMAKQALKGAAANHNQSQGAANQNTQQVAASHPAQLPAPPPAVDPPRQSANRSGVVLDLFRDAATDLDIAEDEWRYGMRDHREEVRDAAEPLVIDLDEAA